MEGKSSPSTLRYTVSATDSPSTSNFDCPQRVCGAVSPKLVAIWIRSLESLGNSSTTNTNCRAGFSGKYSNPWNLFCCARVNGEFWSPLTSAQQKGFQGLEYFPENPALQFVLVVEESPNDSRDLIQMATSFRDTAPHTRWG